MANTVKSVAFFVNDQGPAIFAPNDTFGSVLGQVKQALAAWDSVSTSDLRVVFGNHAHRLDPDLGVVAGATLPRPRPYNGFVILPDGHLATKDFAGSRPGAR